MSAPSSSSYPQTRLFVESHLQKGAMVEIEGEQAHYLTRVMRLKEGDAVALFNGRQGEWRACLASQRKKHLTLEVQEQLCEHLPPPDVTLCFAPIKFGRIDYLVQKATELGAATLQPVMTQYTQAERVNLDRLRAHAIEAAEQCERVEVPTLAEPVSLPVLLGNWPADRPLLFGDESGKGQAFDAITQSAPSSWGILIGPEGGFSPAERALLYGVKAVQGISLGPRILRADTAAITLLALSVARWGDWQIPPHFRRAEA